MSNIALIGMAGVGKSFVGKKLAERIGYNYVEADKLITSEASKLGIRKGLLPDDDFIKLEEKIILGLKSKQNSIFDTGGSVVYSEKAMLSLKSNSFVVYLKDSMENIKERFEARGEPHLIGIEGKTFEELLRERDRLYTKYADFIVNVSKYNSQDILHKIMTKAELP